MAEPELFRLYIRRRPNENLNFTIEPNFSFSEDLIELGIKKFDLLVKIDGECFFLILRVGLIRWAKSSNLLLI